MNRAGSSDWAGASVQEGCCEILTVSQSPREHGRRGGSMAWGSEHQVGGSINALERSGSRVGWRGATPFTGQDACKAGSTALLIISLGPFWLGGSAAGAATANGPRSCAEAQPASRPRPLRHLVGVGIGAGVAVLIGVAGSLQLRAMDTQ